MPHEITITLTADTEGTLRSPLPITLEEGKPLFVVGQNGAGKSGLMWHLSRTIRLPILHAHGHRSNTMHSANSQLNAESRREIDRTRIQQAYQPFNRYIDYPGEQFISSTLFDVFAAEQARDRRYAAAARADDAAAKQAADELRSPLKELNRLFDRSGLPVQVRINDDNELEAVKGGNRYAANKMSDGERNALIITGQVTTARAGAAVMIDEPERHLHPSVMLPLIAGLVALRPDCYFVIATHDLDMPREVPGAQTLILRGCEFENDHAVAWDADLLPAGASIDDDLRTAIIGARRTVLFVEGTATSLDRALYQLLFPRASIVPQSNCRDVQNAVRGVTKSGSLTWLSAFGVIDNDGRPAAELAALEAEGVYPLAVSTVESVYYHPEVIRRVAERLVAAYGGHVGDMLADARTGAIAALRPNIEALATRRALHKVRSMIFDRLPDDRSIAGGDPVSIQIDTAAERDAFKADLEASLTAGDWTTAIARYGIKNTGAKGAIATALGLRSRAQYEEAVLQLMTHDPAAREAVMPLFGRLPAALRPPC